MKLKRGYFVVGAIIGLVLAGDANVKADPSENRQKAREGAQRMGEVAGGVTGAIVGGATAGAAGAALGATAGALAGGEAGKVLHDSAMRRMDRNNERNEPASMGDLRLHEAGRTPESDKSE